VRRLLVLAALALLTACGSGVAAQSNQNQPAPNVAGADNPPPAARASLSWPPAESWISPPSPQGPAQPLPDWPTPTPAPAPDGQHHPATSPYAALSRGYDASYPQCQSGSKPAAGAYGILGVNNGRSFTLNPCFLALFEAAPAGAAGIYLNTGFNAANAPRMLPSCALRAAALPATTEEQRLAYGLGCSTTEDTLAVLRLFKIAYPSVWWLDVEEANSWDDGNPDVNRYSLAGQLDILRGTGKAVGVYSTFPDWQQITGGWSDPRIAGNWVAGKLPQDACSNPGFSAAPVWLAQELATWAGSGYDSDYAC
jgi:hypothetical protein